MEIFLQIIIVLGCIFIGASYKGIGLGIWGGFGLGVLVLAFGIRPTSPPIDVMLIITAVITAASVMYSAGGVDFMVRVAEKIIRSNPKQITIIAPITTWFFAFLAGTAHIGYPLLPVIYEVAVSVGIRPEKPMAVSAVACQQAITASPVSAATAALLGLFAAKNFDISLGQILMITVPASIIGVFAASFVQIYVGKNLKDDPQLLENIRRAQTEVTIEKKALPKRAWLSALIFVLGVVFVVLTGFFPELRTVGDAKKAISMASFLQIFMFVVAAVILIVCKCKLKTAVESPIMRAGVTALIAVFGLAWLGDSFISAHKAALLAAGKDIVGEYPWVFAICLFALSVVLHSQAATVRALMPLGLALGISSGALIGMYPAVNGLFFVPTSGLLVAAIAFDRSGSTKIGRYVLNHSFMIPGFVATVTAVITGLILQQILF